MKVIALIPARAGSKGIPNKNFRQLCGRTPVERAWDVANKARADVIAITSDVEIEYMVNISGPYVNDFLTIRRPAELAQDDTPMFAVVQHALQQIPGEFDDVIVLLQPTAVLREPRHVTAAITKLRETKADSVVSVVALPLTHNPEWQYTVRDDQLEHWPETYGGEGVANRQELSQTYIRDGTVYSFRRMTLETGTIYGNDCRALIIPASESCSLDTMDDWHEAERRLQARNEVAVAFV